MPDDTDRMNELLERQRRAFLKDGPPGLKKRLDLLDRLENAVRSRQDDFCKAISADFSVRSEHETVVAEIFLVIEAIRQARAKVGKWMRPARRCTSMAFFPGKSMVMYQPLGCVGIISPWNYPVQLALSPMVGALAAGNRVMLKPSELTPATSDLLATVLGEAFAAEEVAVLTGGAEIGRAFSSLPFDHLFFTGSPNVGSLVMQAAAKNLVPVTLELGGKSPALVLPGFDMDRAALSIATGKLFNAGQTCIAPDYAMVPAGSVASFVESMKSQVASMYPSLAGNPDYTAIINDAHRERINRLVDDAAAKGARVVRLNPAEENLAGSGKIAPTIVLDVDDDMPLMREEIFGPVLPVMEYDTLDEAISYVQRHPRPLALYCFGNDNAPIDRILNLTVSGGVTVNDTLLHVAQESLPFGGVGNSGMGTYHGEDGFRTFSHAKSVFFQRRLNGMSLIRPPYGHRFNRLMRFLIDRKVGKD
ncbi:MAG: coniferyl aldehyde dehydrogenase [Deltaproteobacteria bacterium]|nr:coniferyl aldehyde dehydrogenase [Deltaproteobacteria bacterium]